MKRALIGFAFVAVLTAPGGARADLPPPDGIKYVSFGFAIDNLAAFPDYVVVAYPASESDGAPTAELFVVDDGKKVHLGRRSPDPTLYAMKRAAFDELKAKAANPPSDHNEDPAVVAFLTSDKVVRCDKVPSPVFDLKKSDPRDEVVQRMRAVKIDDQSCHLESQSASSLESGDGDASGPKKGGCAGCETAPVRGSAPGLFAATMLLFALRRSRR